MNLVICEKNIAAKRISFILSDGKYSTQRYGKVNIYTFTHKQDQYTIIGLKGHIINLDYPTGYNQWTKTSLEELITVEPVKKISEKNIASALKTLIQKNPFIIVATDFDREGELIGVEAIELLKEHNQNITNIKRAKFSAITKQDIKHAFDHFIDVDYNLSDAGQARQIIDLVWGAVLTRFISLTTHRLGKNFLSIGRVQSPTLALLVQREKEIQNFTPTPYWQLIAHLTKNQPFQALHKQDKFWEQQQAQNIYNNIKHTTHATITNLTIETHKERPPAPFNTTSFLQSASALGYTASKAMILAEELYMTGAISYPRTDNTVYPPTLNLKNIVKKLQNSPFKKEATQILQNGRPYPTRGSKETTDHPPIHPVGIPPKTGFTTDHQKIYELIVRRFLATQAKDALIETTNATFDISNEPFIADGIKTLEPNWRAIYPYYEHKKKPLPPLKKGETIPITKIQLKKDKTKPPKRYTQGQLIQKMEQLQLGTKSTRHEIISKLYSRKYVTGTTPRPTSTGIAVIEALGDFDVTKPTLTAQLEENMNKIAEGTKTLNHTVQESRKILATVLHTLEQEKETIRSNITNALKEQNKIGACPKCGKDLVIRTSKRGKRFVGCSGYPNCENTYSLPQQGHITTTTKTCKTCKSPIVNIRMKGKKLWQLCLNSDCPAKQKKQQTKDDVKKKKISYLPQLLLQDHIQSFLFQL